MEERKAPKTKSLDEVYSLLDELSDHPDDVIYIYVEKGTKSFSIEMIKEDTYSLVLLDSARRDKETDYQGVVNVIDNFENFLAEPTAWGFSEKDLY